MKTCTGSLEPPNGALMIFRLSNRNGAVVGEVTVTSSDGSLVLGSLVPAQHFASYERLIEDLEHSANNQLLVEMDRLEQEIASQGFHVIGPSPLEKCAAIKDLQITGNGVSFCFSRHR
jgi:hypothetical protein